MEVGNSSLTRVALGQPNTVRTDVGDLDDVDRHIVRELARDARTPNNALAERVGIAPSTCLGRVRSLRERGVIRGYHADVDPAALGRPLQAMIAVRLQGHARGHIRSFVAGVAGLPEVLNVFFLAGKDDFLLHVAAASTHRCGTSWSGSRRMRTCHTRRRRSSSSTSARTSPAESAGGGPDDTLGARTRPVACSLCDDSVARPPRRVRG